MTKTALPSPDETASVVLEAALVEAARRGLDAGDLWSVWEHSGFERAEVPDGGLISDALDESHRSGLPAGWVLGRVQQAAEVRSSRRARGAFYTPFDLASGLTNRALDSLDPDVTAPVVCDPTCGGGAFLVAAAQLLADRGIGPGLIGPRLIGFDVDPVAVMTTRMSLVLWLTAHGASASGPDIGVLDVIHGESLDSVDDGFDLIIGNPPFLGQLRNTSARTKEQRGSLAKPRGYADAAFVVLERSLDWVRSGGCIALIQPQSLLAARDAKPVRERIVAEARLDGLWLGAGDLFDASVQVCAPIISTRPGPTQRVTNYLGSGVEAAGDSLFTSWPELLADVQGVPPVDSFTRPDPARRSAEGSLRVGGSAEGRLSDGDRADGGPTEVVPTGGPLAEGRVTDGSSTSRKPTQAHPTEVRSAGERLTEMSTVTADFRQWFYDLSGHVAEAEELVDPLPVMTSGLIDPMRSNWGIRPARVGGRRWDSPAVESAVVRDQLRASSRLVPKVLVANQTRCIEAVVDDTGIMIPNTPIITVTPFESTDIWLAAAVLLSPLTSAIIRRRAAGSGMSSGAVRLTATMLGELPLPTRSAEWDAAAGTLRRVAEPEDGGQVDIDWVLIESATLMQAAYGLDARDDLLAWWKAQLPTPKPITGVKA